MDNKFYNGIVHEYCRIQKLKQMYVQNIPDSLHSLLSTNFLTSRLVQRISSQEEMPRDLK